MGGEGADGDGVGVWGVILGQCPVSRSLFPTTEVYIKLTQNQSLENLNVIKFKNRQIYISHWEFFFLICILKFYRMS